MADIARLEPFLVVGIEGRTSNAREIRGEGIIGKFWGRLAQEGLLDRIPNRADDRIIAVYSDYENGKDGDYSYLLGAKTSATTNLPEGMVSREIAAGGYRVFSAQDGPPAEMVIGIWREIWSLEDAKQLARAYKTDFEVYAGTRVDIYLGVLLGVFGKARTAPVEIPPSTSKV